MRKYNFLLPYTSTLSSGSTCACACVRVCACLCILYVLYFLNVCEFCVNMVTSVEIVPVYEHCVWMCVSGYVFWFVQV